MEVIDRPRLHVGRIFASAQGRRDTLHDRRWNGSDMAGGGTVHMAAEDGRHPTGLLYGLA